jgi:hypothetical protein
VKQPLAPGMGVPDGVHQEVGYVPSLSAASSYVGCRHGGRSLDKGFGWGIVSRTLEVLQFSLYEIHYYSIRVNTLKIDCLLL